MKDSKYVRLLALWTSRVNGFIIFDINIWRWKNYPQEGCRDCPQLTKNETVWCIPRMVCICFIGMCNTFWQWTKHEHITESLRSKKSRNTVMAARTLKQKWHNRFVSQQSCDSRFLGMSKNNLCRLLGMGSNNYRFT